MNRLIKKETYINVLKNARPTGYWTCHFRALTNILETKITNHSFTNDTQLFTVHLPLHSLKLHLPRFINDSLLFNSHLPRFTNHLPPLPPWIKEKLVLYSFTSEAACGAAKQASNIHQAADPFYLPLTPKEKGIGGAYG